MKEANDPTAKNDKGDKIVKMVFKEGKSILRRQVEATRFIFNLLKSDHIEKKGDSIRCYVVVGENSVIETYNYFAGKSIWDEKYFFTEIELIVYSIIHLVKPEYQD